jgi:DNA repair protein RecN (Recombination protein N)
MLEELSVRNYGIIEEVNWSPGAGLNIISGETGAGKSLVVDAVEALLSGQIDEADIRHGSGEARIEGIFQTSENSSTALIRNLLEDRGLETDDDTLLISCDFRRQGRATPRVNRQAVSRALLRNITSALLDIHGQSQHLSLLNREKHLDYLDAYARTRNLREEFGVKAGVLHDMDREMGKLSEAEEDMARQVELLSFQIDEINRAGLQTGEEEELEQEKSLLASAEKLKAAAYEIYRTIYGDDNLPSSSAVVDRLNDALPVLKQIADADSSMKPRLEYFEEMVHGLEETARDIRSYGDNLNYDPQRLEEVQNRLDLIRNLNRKYGGSIEAVLAYLEKATDELEGLEYSGERRQQLEKETEQLKAEMGEIAREMSEKRKNAAERLAIAVKKECEELSMAEVEFQVSLERETSPDGVPLADGGTYRFTNSGVDIVEFRASTNPGEPVKSLDKIASTGEISRFMLALKSALAEADMVPVLIFDEIDIGVGGRSGEVIGMKLWKLAQNHQVICVTHLPQIAAFADVHFNVSKQAAGQRTTSSIRSLDGEARLNELAEMLGGSKFTSSALDAARELMEKAGEWKKKTSG